MSPAEAPKRGAAFIQRRRELVADLRELLERADRHLRGDLSPGEEARACRAGQDEAARAAAREAYCRVAGEMEVQLALGKLNQLEQELGR